MTAAGSRCVCIVYCSGIAAALGYVLVHWLWELYICEKKLCRTVETKI